MLTIPFLLILLIYWIFDLEWQVHHLKNITLLVYLFLLILRLCTKIAIITRKIWISKPKKHKKGSE